FYSSSYGDPGNVPYRLQQPMTTDTTVMQAAVDMTPPVSGGSDGPESYARVLYESAHDPAIGWRPGSRRLHVDFGDNVPHDCNISSCLGGTSQPEGHDPGRDGVQETADDLIFADVLPGPADAGITLLHFDNSWPGGTG